MNDEDNSAGQGGPLYPFQPWTNISDDYGWIILTSLLGIPTLFNYDFKAIAALITSEAEGRASSSSTSGNFFILSGPAWPGTTRP